MGNPFLFADRFSGAVVHLTTDGIAAVFTATAKTQEFHVALPRRYSAWQVFPGENDKMPASANWRRHFD